MEPDSSSIKSPLSLISSTSSVVSTVSSEGVMVTSGPGSVASSPPELVERKAAGTSSSYASSTDSECGGFSSSRKDSSEEMESVDGLVLMGSTRLRPAPQASSSGLSKARLYVQTFQSMFDRLDCTSAILPLALHGNLQNNPFRFLFIPSFVFLKNLCCCSGQSAGGCCSMCCPALVWTGSQLCRAAAATTSSFSISSTLII